MIPPTRRGEIICHEDTNSYISLPFPEAEAWFEGVSMAVIGSRKGLGVGREITTFCFVFDVSRQGLSCNNIYNYKQHFEMLPFECCGKIKFAERRVNEFC